MLDAVYCLTTLKIIMMMQSTAGWTHLCLSEILLTIRLVVFLLHERNPVHLTFFDEWLDIHCTQGVATDPLLVLKYKAVL